LNRNFIQIGLSKASDILELGNLPIVEPNKQNLFGAIVGFIGSEFLKRKGDIKNI
jgi:hypothetical protein